jgi:hypothetical protein
MAEIYMQAVIDPGEGTLHMLAQYTTELDYGAVSLCGTRPSGDYDWERQGEPVPQRDVCPLCINLSRIIVGE